MSDFAREPWRFGVPDGLRSDLHGTAELEAAWEAMRERVRGLERERNAALDAAWDALHAAGLVERMKTMPRPKRGPAKVHRYQPIGVTPCGRSVDAVGTNFAEYCDKYYGRAAVNQTLSSGVTCQVCANATTLVSGWPRQCDLTAVRARQEG